MKPPFPGDNGDKRAARLFVYKAAMGAPRGGHAIALAGSDPDAEVSLMRDYLGWSPERAWFVDSSKAASIQLALGSIRAEWPAAHVVGGKLQNILPKLDGIGFAHLDFMGHLNPHNVIPCLRETAARLLKGGIIGLTWMRGRERLDLHRTARKIWRKGVGFQGNDRRWAGVMQIISEATGNRLRLVGALEYQNHRSPMSVTILSR